MDASSLDLPHNLSRRYSITYHRQHHSLDVRQYGFQSLRFLFTRPCRIREEYNSNYQSIALAKMVGSIPLFQPRHIRKIQPCTVIRTLAYQSGVSQPIVGNAIAIILDDFPVIVESSLRNPTTQTCCRASPSNTMESFKTCRHHSGCLG